MIPATLFSGTTMLFVAFALGAIVTATMVVLNPNPIRAALFLVLNLFCVAVLYLLLNAYFLAAVQVIVYAGAIMVLFLFVIMLLNLGSPDRTVDRLRLQQPIAVTAGLLLAVVLGWTLFSSVPTTMGAILPPKGVDPSTLVRGDAMGTPEGIGKTLFHPEMPWLLPFELTSILLLVAVIGSVVLSRRHEAPREEPGVAVAPPKEKEN